MSLKAQLMDDMKAAMNYPPRSRNRPHLRNRSGGHSAKSGTDMDGGRENRFLAGGAEISRRGGGITAAPVRTKAPHRCKARAVMVF